MSTCYCCGHALNADLKGLGWLCEWCAAAIAAREKKA